MNRPSLIAAAGVVIIVIAIAMSWWSKHRDEQTPPPAQTAAQSGPDAAAPQAAAKLPSFDIVRINPQGETVIAGRAMPKAEVTILDGGQKLGSVVADNRGEWVFVPDKPLPAGQRELTLKATNPDGTTAETDAPVVLVVPDRTKDKNASLAVKVNPDGTIDILQGPAAEAGAGGIVITGVRYDEKGRLAVSGTATPKAVVQLYLDDQPLARTQADDKGHWQAAPHPALHFGAHIVRADELGPDGKVAERAEISFTLPTDLPASGQVVVQPGNSLWRIARRALGSGFDYMEIYQANKGQIRDPNLIYPGQVFTIPEKR